MGQLDRQTVLSYINWILANANSLTNKGENDEI